MIKYKHFNKKNNYHIKNKIVIVSLVIILSLLVVLQPLQAFGFTSKEEEIQKELNAGVIETLDEIDFSGFNNIIADFEENQISIFSLNSIKDKVYEIISGENAVNYSSFFASIFSNIIEVVISYLPILSVIVAIGVISNLLNGIKSKFNEKSTGNIISLVCFFAAVILIVSIVNNLSTKTGKTIHSMVKQMNVVFPILLTLMAATGASASVGVFQPIVAIMSTYIADIFNYYILPLFIVSFVFSIISNFSDNIKLDKFNSFISSLFKWSVGLIFTLFFAVFTIQGITAGSFDSIGIRTTKYTIKSYIPVMGGHLSDGMDIILASSLLVKNAVGLVGILLIITSILSPLIEIIVFSLLIKLVSAILQPMGSKVSTFLETSSKSITMLSSSIIAIGFMYLISVGLTMSVSNMVM